MGSRPLWLRTVFIRRLTRSGDRMAFSVPPWIVPRGKQTSKILGRGVVASSRSAGGPRLLPIEDNASPGLIGTARHGKVQYLDGLRGVAAAQVVLMHFVSGFLPNIAARPPPPLQVLWDGHTAVYVFFLISGAVLTPSFARGGAWPRQAAKRLVRLGVPVAAAAVVALVLLAAMPDAHLAAARLSG